MKSIRPLRRVLFLAGLALLIALLTGSAALAAKPDSHGHGGGSTPTPTPTPGPKVICIDPGHGGSDPGAVYGGLQEKDITLQIAGILGKELGDQGYGVTYTRTTDVYMTNTQRAEACNAANADAVIAIHLNASSNQSIDYFQDFWGKKNKDLAFAQAITDHYSIKAATGTGDLTDNAVGQFASSVLLKTNAPATLAETVFLSNTDEQKLLSDGTNARQQEIADALDAGLVAWLGAP